MKQKTFLISHLLLLGVIMIFLLSACNRTRLDNPFVAEPGKQAVAIGNAKKGPAYHLRLVRAISDTFPAFVFDIVKMDKQEMLEIGLQYTYTITISCQENPELISQAFEVTSLIDNINEHEISFVDIDFDGYLDIEIKYTKSTGNNYFDYYRWDSIAGKYEETAFFHLLHSGYQLFPDTKQMISTNDYGTSYTRRLYQLMDGEYVALRYEYAVVLRFPGGYEWLVYIKSENREIHSERCTYEEYYDISPERDNVLRYGMEEVISQEEAYELLVNRFGIATILGEGESSVSEFPLSFTLEEMVVVYDIPCYSFRLSWAVENHHWLFADEVFVMPDGTIFSSDRTS